MQLKKEKSTFIFFFHATKQHNFLNITSKSTIAETFTEHRFAIVLQEF